TSTNHRTKRTEHRPSKTLPQNERKITHVPDRLRDQMPELRSPTQPLTRRISSYLQILRLHLRSGHQRAIPAATQPHNQQPQQLQNYPESARLDEVRI